MEVGEIILVNLVGDDNIIGKIKAETDTQFVIGDARRIKIMPKPGAKDIGVMFTPINIFADMKAMNNEITIVKSNILSMLGKSDIREDMMNNYISQVTGIFPAKSMPKDVVTPEVV